MSNSIKMVLVIACMYVVFGAFADTQQSGGIVWSYTVAGDAAEVTGVDPCSGAIVVPATLGGKRVASIGDNAFYGCHGMTSVTIPTSMTRIGKFAFSYCSGLTSVVIPEGVMYIGNDAFDHCSNLTAVDIPTSVTSVGDKAFYACGKLIRVDISDLAAWCRINFGGVLANPLYYAKHLYLSGKELDDLAVPTGVMSIGSYAFSGCSGLKSVTIPSGVTSIGSSAFSECSGLTSVTIPTGMTTIGSFAFSGCSGLTEVTVPTSATGIGDGAFGGCSGLTSITLPFVGSKRGNSGTKESLFGYVFGTSSYLGATATEQYYSTLGSAIFYIPTALKSVVITDETKIGYKAFSCCGGLMSVTIPPSVTNIGDGAFHYCSGLKSVTIPTGVTSIGRFTFQGCSGLTSVTIPSSVTSIGSSAFYGCSGLTEVTMPSSVSSIGGFAFAYCVGLTLVTIPSSVTGIGECVFEACSGLRSVEIPKGVTSIGRMAFSHCSGLAEVTLPSSVSSIGEFAFQCCGGLTLVTISEGVTSIGDYAFSRCDGLMSVTIPSSVTSIGSSAFNCCGELVSVTVPSSVMSIGKWAFSGCDLLAVVYVNKGDAERVRGLYDWPGGVNFVEGGVPVVEGDEGAIVIGDPERGLVIRPSAENADVVVAIPQGVVAAKVTVEVTPNVKSVKPNGATVKVISGNADITQFLDIPGTRQNKAGGVVAVQNDAVIDLTKAAVKEEIVRETLDPAKGAVVDLDPSNPELTTANTRIGLIYTFREGRTLACMKKSGDGHVGDGDPWTPEIKVKGGDSAFYSIGVGMTDEPDSEAGETLPYDDALYCVIDLSGGTSATKYPVSVLDDVPSGGWTEEYKTTKLVLRRIEPGSYLIQNQYEIVLTKPFYIGVFEVTQKQYELVMGSNPSSYKGDTRPVECVTYDSIRGTNLGTHWPTDNGVDTQSFLGRLRNKTGLDFDLPTEAEWEYACRAGTTSVYNNGGSSLSDLKQVARCYYNCNDGKGGYSVAHTTVGSYLVNAWGLYDMHGNVWEWCRDWEGSLAAGTDPKGAATSSAGAGRVHRGGCWYGDSNGCTATIRGGGDPSSGDYYKGFRISRTLR